MFRQGHVVPTMLLTRDSISALYAVRRDCGESFSCLNARLPYACQLINFFLINLLLLLSIAYCFAASHGFNHWEIIVFVEYQAVVFNQINHFAT
jgi:hypothetical protein